MQRLEIKVLVILQPKLMILESDIATPRIKVVYVQRVQYYRTQNTETRDRFTGIIIVVSLNKRRFTERELGGFDLSVL